MKVELPSFGIQWPSWANTLIGRHMACARENMGRGSLYHRRAIIQALWPNDYEWSDWNERRLAGFCSHYWNTWLGPAASGKSTDAARIALAYWLEAPHETSVVIVSTTHQMLRRRIWSEVVRYFKSIPRTVTWTLEDGRAFKEEVVSGPSLLDSVTMIRWQEGDPKHGIFGIAVEQGPIEDAVNNIFGIHPRRYLLVLDELQGIPEAIIAGTSNITKNQESRGLGMGNPMSMMNPLVKESEPLGGWDSVVRGETPRWETLGGFFKGNGLCQFFDGRKSPAITDPDGVRKFPKIINQEQIDNHLKGLRGNANDPFFWAQSIGWPPPVGTEQTVIDEAIASTFRLRQRAVWTVNPRKWSSLDPSFEGGDKKVLTLGRVGEITDAEGTRWQIGCDEQIDVQIDAASNVPLHYQIAYWVRDYLVARGYKPEEFALDSTGEGGGLYSIFCQEWGQVVAVEFGGKPSEMRVNQFSDKTADEEYLNRAAELNFQFREFALGNGLRGVPEDVIHQAVHRRTETKNTKRRVEPKGMRVIAGQKVKGFKDRMGFSPDHMDSFCVGIELCRQMGAVAAVKDAPAADTPQSAPKPPEPDEFADENYLEEDFAPV